QAAAVSAEIKALDQELLSQPMRIQLLQAQRDRSARSLKRLDTRVELLEEALAKRRSSEAEKAVAEAETASDAAETGHPVARELADRNKALGLELTRLTRELEQTAAREINANAALKRVNDE
ncbi:MAG: mechanosensitive ion channel domain-containing protein, partial [Gammaproteobacteria bacterium]